MESLFRWRFIHESSRAVTTERGAVSEPHGREDEHARHHGTSSSGIGRARLDIGGGGGRVDGFVGIDADDAGAGSGDGHARARATRARTRLIRIANCPRLDAAGRVPRRRARCDDSWVTQMLLLKLMLVVGACGVLLTLVGVVHDIRESFELVRLTRRDDGRIYAQNSRRARRDGAGVLRATIDEIEDSESQRRGCRADLEGTAGKNPCGVASIPPQRSHPAGGLHLPWPLPL